MASRYSRSHENEELSQLDLTMNSGDEGDGPMFDNATEEEADSAISSFWGNNSRISMVPSTGRMPFPVVIPQRRPGHKQRGFMKAYAPVLSDFGISKDHFHDFIDALNKAIRVSKWIAAVQIAAFGASFVPNHISMGVTAAVQLVSAVAAKAQVRWKVNSFLDQANQELFCPRGLCCLILKYNPVPEKEQEDIDAMITASSSKINSTVSKTKWQEKLKTNFRNPFSATTEGEHNLPSDIMPLIFSEQDNEDKQPKTKGTLWNEVNRYLDKRARAVYAAENSNDILSAAPDAGFRNRFLDPNHPATNGGLLGLLSGGHLTKDPEKAKQEANNIIHQQLALLEEQRISQLELLHNQCVAMGYSDLQMQEITALYEQQFQQQRQQLQTQILGANIVPRKISRDVLYLMIVNLPNEEEIEIAKMAMSDKEDDSRSQHAVMMVNV